MINTKSRANEQRTELDRIKAASASLVRRAKKNPAVAREFLQSVGFYDDNKAQSRGRAAQGTDRAGASGSRAVSHRVVSPAKDKSVHKSSSRQAVSAKE